METGSPGKRPVLPKRARLLVTAGMGMLALLLFGPRLVDIYVDWLWFGEVGFRSVWITVLLTRLAIVAAVALVVAGIVLAALLLAYRSRPCWRIARGRSLYPTSRSGTRSRHFAAR